MSADADTPLPKTDKALRQLKRFRPREALTIINSSAGGDEMAFARTWALARLLAWAVLDQRPGKRLPKTPGSGAEKSPTRPLRARNARLVGHLTLARLLDQRLQREGAKKDDETLRVMLALFRLCGGFGVFVQSRGAKGLLSNAKRVNRELGYVYRIVLFLCRYKKHIGGDGKFDIDTAKRFVAKNMHEGDKTYGLSAISKEWEKYKQAAPYIFAFYGYFSSALERTKSPNEVVNFLEKLSSNQQRLARIIGHAAYAAEILDARARRVRLRDFTQIARVEPPLPAFAPVEVAIIDSIDRQGAIP
jgi:hypothetical protein